MTIQPTVLHPENNPDTVLHPETDAGQVTDFLNKTYPVNSIYMSVDSTSPASLFGGTWTQIKNGFLLSAGYQSIAAGTTGGNHLHVVNERNLPSSRVGLFQNITGSSYTGFKALSTTSTTTSANNYAYATATHANEVLGQNVESGIAMTIYPPYLAVYMWKRVA